MNAKTLIAIASILGASGVILGAFAAHVLEDKLSIAGLETFETAVRYQMYHALGLLLLGILQIRYGHKRLALSALFWIIGILLFSGSLYALSFAEHLPKIVRTILGPITPVGGSCLIIGWIQLMRYAFILPD